MNWSALSSLRIWWGAILVGLLACILPGLLWPPLGTLAFLLAFAWVMYYQLALSPTPLRCPRCRKRIKIGATACSHCDRGS